MRGREAWPLDAAGAFLNHGSFGACPHAVLEEQARIRARMESQPDRFFRDEVMPREGARTPLREAAACLADFVGADEASIAFVENATTGVQAILDSVALAPGDEVLITDHTYNAVRLMVEARCATAGAVVRVARIPLPASAEGIVAAVDSAMSPRVKLAILDHITSPTALVMPLERVVPRVRAQGARVVVDGAHAVGQLPLSLPSLGADWYVSNAHKWLFAPRGTAFLFASPEVAALTRPTVVSHFIEMGFPRSFDWIGTRDYSAWLSVPAAIEFWRALGPEAVRSHQRRLLEACTRMLAPLGIEPVAPLDPGAAMRSFVLPQARPAVRDDALHVMADYWARERIQVMAVAFGERLLLRVSAHAYTSEADFGRLAAALPRLGWPGRR